MSEHSSGYPAGPGRPEAGGRYVSAPAGFVGPVAVLQGPRLLSTVGAGPGLAAHRATWAEPAAAGPQALVDQLRHTHLVGRGGAAFPFGRKLVTALNSGKRRELVVNAAEGEPGSAKDSALMTTVPHLVFDGAETVARAMKVRTIHVVLAGERPAVAKAVREALRERAGGRAALRYELHRTSGGFVGGQSRAVIEMLEGRADLPVTSWKPEAVDGLHGRPTLLSNAETFAQVAVLWALGAGTYNRAGTPAEPGTTLLTIAGDGPGGVVCEVPLGESLAAVLMRCGYEPDLPVLIGGYHGTWLPPQETRRRTVSRADLAEAGATLGAGVVLPLDRQSCPVVLTARIVDYLAGQSAGRCGPCFNGLPALAEALTLLGAGSGGLAIGARVRDLTAVVDRRGACAHPDGTARLVRSLHTAFAAEVAAHERGICTLAAA